jgi:hypothetical protein
MGRSSSLGELSMSIEDPSRNKRQCAVLIRNADRLTPLRESVQRDHESFDVLSLPLNEAPALSDDEWQRRSIDNILSLLEANAKLRALAVRLSDILDAAGMANNLDTKNLDTKNLDDSARDFAPRMGKLRRSGRAAD